MYIVISLLVLLVLGFVVPFMLAKKSLTAIFPRYRANELLLRLIEEFPGLEVKECSFLSNKGQKLAGYKYYRPGTTPRGVVIIAHGMGVGGQCVYMDVTAYFTAHGYLVFAYDATGHDKSEGPGCLGLEQGVIDLDRAIAYVEQDPQLQHYPLFLYGHSWGAYSACAVLNLHPEIKAVVAVAGFNRALDFLRHAVSDNKWFSLLLPYLQLVEKLQFGSFTQYTALGGFANTKAGIMIIQSKNDRNVPPAQGYDLYYAKYQNDPRFCFKLYEDRGHLFPGYTAAARAYTSQYINELYASFTEYAQTHDFDTAIGFQIDPVYFADILAFYDEYCH